jgi:tripartite-type tricarboxylate transporter receptor subunit TctC
MGVAVCAGALALSVGAYAQPWPQRAVKLILPFGAGSGTDAAARLLGERLSARWGFPVVIENRPGGDGLVAISSFASAADDHVLLYASTASFIAHPFVHEKLPYVLDRDLQPIAKVSNTVMAVAAPAAAEFKTIADFVTSARVEPGKYNVSGAAGLPEFTVDAFVKSRDLKVTKVPYRDVLQAARDLGENRIQLLLTSYAVVRPLVEAGKIRVLAVGSAQRTSILPDIVTADESGFPELSIETTSGLYGRAGMPIELRKRIAADVMAAAQDRTIAERITATGQDMVPAGPEELAETLKQQAAKAAAVANIVGLQRKN